MRLLLLEPRPALGIDQRRDGIGKPAVRIAVGGIALRLDKDRPARAQPTKRIVEPRRGADELGRRCRVEIGTAKTRRALEAAVLIEHHARSDECRPGQEVSEQSRALAIFGEVHHIHAPAEMRRRAQVTAHHVDELRVALGRPDRGRVSDGPEQETRNPQPQAEADRGGERAVSNGNCARRATEQDRIAQRAMHGRVEATDGFDGLSHQITAPPPNEKNDRKKLEAAKAIDSPNTIWISRRKPPEVSPKASVRPVVTMMITAMILETGPSIDCRI